jgi:periplasmic copper chaperone A
MLKITKILILGALIGVHAADAMANDAATHVVAEDAFVRAIPEGQKNSAVFMVLKNHGDTDHALVEARSDAAHIVELHTHINEDGMMKMRRVERIEVMGGAATVLEPGGLHVMLIDLKRAINEDDEVTVELEFEDGSTLQVAAPARKVPTTMNSHTHGGTGSMSNH